MIEIVAAVANGNVIGNRGKLPWQGQMPADMDHFVGITAGHIVVMGRKTWESIPERFRPLHRRANVVISRRHLEGAEGLDKGWSKEINQSAGLYQMADLDLLEEASGAEAKVYVIGGSQIYVAAWELAERLHITNIDADFAGDSYFPKIKTARWMVQSSMPYRQADEANKYPYWFTTYRKRT